MDAKTRKELAAVKAWNDEYPIGTKVVVLMDSGCGKITVTQSKAWMLGENSQHPGHTAVIMVHGISGGYLLNRCGPVRSAFDINLRSALQKI